MGQATQETVQVQPSSNEDTENEDDRAREDSRADEEEESGRERLEAEVKGQEVAPVAESDADDADVEQEEEMDVGSDEEFDDEGWIPMAPTQPAGGESVKKR